MPQDVIVIRDSSSYKQGWSIHFQYHEQDGYYYCNNAEAVYMNSCDIVLATVSLTGLASLKKSKTKEELHYKIKALFINELSLLIQLLTKESS